MYTLDGNASWIYKYKDKQQSSVTPTLIPFVACDPHIMALNPPSSSVICSSKYLKCSNYSKAPYIVSSYRQFPRQIYLPGYSFAAPNPN